MVVTIARSNNTVSSGTLGSVPHSFRHGVLVGIVLLCLISEPFVCHWACWSSTSQFSMHIPQPSALHVLEQTQMTGTLVAAPDLLSAFVCMLQPSSGDPQSSTHDTGSLAHHEHQGSAMLLSVSAFIALLAWAADPFVATTPQTEPLNRFRPPLA